MTSLFSALFDLLVNGWDAFRRGITTKWSAFILLIGLVYGGFSLIGDMTIYAVARVSSVLTGGSLSAGYAGSVGGEVLAIANTFFPLDEALRLMAAMLLGVWLPLGLYKLVKSWLPVFGGAGA